MVWGVGFVWVVGFRAWVVGLRVQGSGFGGLEVWGFALNGCFLV